MAKPTRDEIRSIVHGILCGMHDVDGVSSRKIFQRFKKETNGRYLTVELTDINEVLNSLAKDDKEKIRVENVLMVYCEN